MKRVLFVWCPHVHNYSVITQSGWYLAYRNSTRPKDQKANLYKARIIISWHAQSPFVFLC